MSLAIACDKCGKDKMKVFIGEPLEDLEQTLSVALGVAGWEEQLFGHTCPACSIELRELADLDSRTFSTDEDQPDENPNTLPDSLVATMIDDIHKENVELLTKVKELSIKQIEDLDAAVSDVLEHLNKSQKIPKTDKTSDFLPQTDKTSQD